MGDFTGFSFDDWHSTDPTTGEVKVVRVSGGDRYTEQLHPEINDRTAEVPGLNGQYYFGSDFGTRSFDIEIAFDHLTEQQFRKLRQVFGTKQIKKLVFDERPYKYYLAKLESPVELSYVCFDEPKRTVALITSDGVRRITRVEQEPVIDEETGEPVIDEETGEPVTESVIYRDLEQVTPYVYEDTKERVYKGEGKLTLVCYFPFAKSNFKALPEKGQDYFEGREEWASSSGILSANSREAQEIDVYSAGAIKVYNPGDVETGFRLYIPASAMGSAITLSYEGAQLKLKPMVAKTYEITYQEVSEPSGNPKEQSWYEYKNAKYTLSTDTEVDENKTYYTKVENKDSGVIIDTNTGLINGIKPSTAMVAQIDENTSKVVEIEEIDVPLHIDYNGNVSYTTSGNIYNECVESGYFFKLQPNIDTSEASITITGVADTPQIFYDYLYF